MHILAGPAQLCPVIAAQGSTTHNRNLHQGNKKGAPKKSERPERSWKLLRAENRVLGGFRDLELDDALGRDLDGGAGGGIAANAGGAVFELQLAEAGQGESVLCVLVRESREVLEVLNGLLLGDADFFSQRGSDL